MKEMPRSRLHAGLYFWIPVLLCCATAAGDLHPARALLENTSAAIIEKLNSERARIEAEPQLLVSHIKKTIIPHFSMSIISRFALGRHWKQANETQRERFMEAFQTLLIRTYGTTLLKHSDKEIRFAPVAAAPNAKQVEVKSEVLLGANQKLPINYRLRLTGERWKVFDIKVNGISLVNTYRGSFNTRIRSAGLDALINDLEQRNQKGFDKSAL